MINIYFIPVRFYLKQLKFFKAKKYFHNIQELISNKINSKREKNFRINVKGDTNDVLPFWIDMDLRNDIGILENGNIKTQKNNAEKPRGTVKCLTYREGNFR